MPQDPINPNAATPSPYVTWSTTFSNTSATGSTFNINLAASKYIQSVPKADEVLEVTAHLQKMSVNPSANARNEPQFLYRANIPHKYWWLGGYAGPVLGNEASMLAYAKGTAKECGYKHFRITFSAD